MSYKTLTKFSKSHPYFKREINNRDQLRRSGTETVVGTKMRFAGDSRQKLVDAVTDSAKNSTYRRRFCTHRHRIVGYRRSEG